MPPLPGSIRGEKRGQRNFCTSDAVHRAQEKAGGRIDLFPSRRTTGASRGSGPKFVLSDLNYSRVTDEGGEPVRDS
jgi:hypothetical protein